MLNMQTPTSADYERIVETHRRALKRIELDLSFFIRDVGDLNVFSISGRVKDYSRALAKAKALGFPVSDLDDLAGVRVVVGTEAEVPIVLRFFSRQEESKDLKVLKTRIIKRKSGYRATHLVVETRSSITLRFFRDVLKFKSILSSSMLLIFFRATGDIISLGKRQKNGRRSSSSYQIFYRALIRLPAISICSRFSCKRRWILQY